MFKPNVFLLLLFTVLFCSCMPSGKDADVYIPPSTAAAETNDASIYHWAKPSVFSTMPPLVIQSVSNARLGHDHSVLEMDVPSVSCFARTAAVDNQTVPIGIFRIAEDGSLTKICTNEVCRNEIDLPCSHLVSAGQHVIWCGNITYLIGMTLSPEDGSAERFFILRLKDGAAEFEKIFETSRTLNNLKMSGDILYAYSHPEFSGDSHIYYAIDQDAQVYTEIITGDETYHFGRDRILMTDDTGTYLVDSILKRAGKCCDATGLDKGVLTENGYWYLKDETLWRADAKVRGKVTKMLDPVRDFTVCGSTVYYQTPPAEQPEVLFYYQEYRRENGKLIPMGAVPYTGYRSAVIRCADLTAENRLVNDRILYMPREQEWIYMFSPFAGLGNAFSFTTIRPGSQMDIRFYLTDYITDGNHLEEVGNRVN